MKLRSFLSQSLLLAGLCLLLAADQTASSAPTSALSADLLTTRLSWCHRNSVQERGCLAALQFMEDELPEGARLEAKKFENERPEERFQELRKLLATSGRDEATWVAGALNAWIATLDLHAKIVVVKEKDKSLAEDRIEVKGAGAKLRFIAGQVLVGYVIEGSGAEAAGLKAGDEILAVNGTMLQGLSTVAKKNFFHALKAPYQIELRRNGSRQFTQVDEKRFVLANVESRLTIGLGTLKIRSFDKADVCLEVKKEIQKLEAAGAERLELDLRDNPGGLVQEARCVAGLLLGKNQLFASLKKLENPELQNFLPSTIAGRALGNQNDVALLTEDKQITELPLEVRINQNTASAAEMLAAALQDNKRAKILGARSFGKGSMQSAFHPWDDQELYLMRTTHLIIRPSGQKIQYAGITPDLIVEKAEGKNFPREQNLTPDAMN